MTARQCLRTVVTAGDALSSLRGRVRSQLTPSLAVEDCHGNRNTVHHVSQSPFTLYVCHPSPPSCLPQQRQLTLSNSLDLQSNLKSILNELNQFRRNTTSLSELSKLRQLSLLLLNEPQAASEVWKVGAVPRIAELSRCGREQVEQQARVALSLLGHPPQYSGRGLRILAVDGGGVR